MPARLIDSHIPTNPAGAVLLLHGGSGRGDAMVSPTQLSVLRMIPIGHAVHRAGAGRLAVLRLLNSARGWGATQTPVDDAHWALDQVAGRFGNGLPVSLIGHSLGGRAALLAAGGVQVRSAVALNPYVYPTDEILYPGPRRILVVHGSQDRIASPQASAAVAQRLRRTADVGFVTVQSGKHAMLRRGRVFERLAAQFAAGTLLDDLDQRPEIQSLLTVDGPASV